VLLGHMHLDHAGNVGKFPNATIVYQRDEIVNAFWPKPGFGCCSRAARELYTTRAGGSISRCTTA
jgi:glyoxylase-like metal-dependent hydrolase (beta-lactamase superfamily II)